METKVVFKTRREFYEKMETLILSHASYDVPEILAIPIVLGSQDYVSWLDQYIEPLA